ncbi:DUF1835 domain-containing protein [Haloflavibacter putidus]|uniref:DUF1835 domain-containing protein n=1 Tax=Haloflavibacter putidus TaxID=2576776 RepID=A0A508A313_9FLAO|nr:DUF1835 domain-containing protein [Haloflavibacter putidus]TQD40232.1 DUF1835 domain-containing protein [Haloflavibacter putidus]
MAKKQLHIVNSDNLGKKIKTLKIEGEHIIWREMLNEGPTTKDIDSEKFIKQRKDFLKRYYGISATDYEKNFVEEIKKFKRLENYKEIILWFEFDLFCHVNMIAALHLINKYKPTIPVYLVCSRPLEKEKSKQPLSALKLPQLKEHYKHRINLNDQDQEQAVLIWKLYCEKNPIKLKPEIKRTSNFEYLSSCIRAHIERFPHYKTGLNSAETNILKLVTKNTIKNRKQLLGYALEYQGYYGYTEIQMQRILKKIDIFFYESENKLQLTEEGLAVINKTKSFYRTLKDDMQFGGVGKYDFLYNTQTHNLMKL